MKRWPIPRLAAGLLVALSFAAGAVLPTVPATPAEPAHSFGAAGLAQAGLGLALVLALIFACGWAVRRFGLQAAGGSRLLKVVASTMVGQRERVVVVEIGDSWLVLGVAAGQVSALHTLPAEKRSGAEAAATSHGFAGAGVFSQKLLEALKPMSKLGKKD